MQTRFSLAKKQLFTKVSVFSQFDVRATSFEKCGLFQTQTRNSVGSQLGRVKVNITKPVNKAMNILYPLPEDKYKKFKKSKIWVNKGQSKEQIKETSSKLNPPGTKKPHKLSERSRELITAIYEAAEKHDPVAAIEAYQRLTAVPDVRCYTALVKSFEKNGEFLGEAVEIYQDMKKLRIPMNVVTYQTLVNCCISAKHWQRAMFFVKEMVQTVNLPQKATPQTTRFFTSVLKFLHEQGLPNRIGAVFQVMQEKNLLPENVQVAEPDSPFPNIPVSFVQLFIQDEKQAQSYLDSVLLPAVNPEYEDLRSFEAPVERETTEFDFLKWNVKPTDSQAAIQNPHHYIVQQMNYASFQGYFEDPLLHQAVKETYNAYYDEAVKKMENDLAAEPVPESLPQIQGLSRQQVEEIWPKIQQLRREYMEKQALSILDAQQLEQIKQEHKQAVKDLVDEKLTKVKWDPVIIGVDGKPFFPKTISFRKVTAETVAAAKKEYLDCVNDPVAKKEIEAELNTRVKLCWYERDTGKLVEGLYY